jgi:hypothetical protein
MFVTLMLIFEISRASFLISCFSLKISCEIKKNFLAAYCHAGGLSHALPLVIKGGLWRGAF